MGLTVTVDFAGVTEGGVTRIPGGEYVFKVVKVDKKQKQGSDYPYLNWKLIGVNGAAKNVTMYEITTLNPNGLFNLYNFLIALGIDVPKKKVSAVWSRMRSTPRKTGLKVSGRVSSASSA